MIKTIKFKIQGTLILISLSLSNCTSKPPEGREQISPSPVIVSTITCPKKEGCNIDNYEKYIYNPGTKCNLSCVKVSEVNTTNWAWNNIPLKYTKKCDALKKCNTSFYLFCVCKFNRIKLE